MIRKTLYITFSISYLLLIPIFSNSQVVISKSVQEKILSLPKSSEASIEKLSETLWNLWPEKEPYVMAVYTWIALNVNYDTGPSPQVFYTTMEKPAEIGEKALQTRSAICQGYSELFHLLLQEKSIPCYVIQGYSKQFTKVLDMSHSWVVYNIGNTWYFSDPTWAAGYVKGKKFIREFTGNWLGISPSDFIKTHMPFDPKFQFLNVPADHEAFYKQNFTFPNELILMSSLDTILLEEKMTEAERISNIYRRVSTSGNVNRSTSEYLKYLKNKLSVLEQNKTIEAHNQSVLNYNSAIESFNASVELFNAYIDAKNKQFGSDWPDQRIKRQLEQIDSLNQLSTKLINRVVSEDAGLLTSLSTLKSQVLDLVRLMSAEQEFFLKYMACPAEDRKKLFYK